jgi:hypothetical protein
MARSNSPFLAVRPLVPSSLRLVRQAKRPETGWIRIRNTLKVGRSGTWCVWFPKLVRSTHCRESDIHSRILAVSIQALSIPFRRICRHSLMVSARPSQRTTAMSVTRILGSTHNTPKELAELEETEPKSVQFAEKRKSGWKNWANLTKISAFMSLKTPFAKNV